MAHNSCYNCWHGRDGDCKLYSSTCATSVFNQSDSPPHWKDMVEGLAEAVRIFGKKKEITDGTGNG